MKAKIYGVRFEINKYDLTDFINLMNQNTIVVFDVMASQFEIINSKLGPISRKYNYIQGFCMTSNGYLYYYRPDDYSVKDVNEFLEKEQNK